MQELRASWITNAETILGAGRGHMGVINYLRTEGLSPDRAKEVSYDVFEEAKKRLDRSQRPHRILAWLFIAAGVLTPIVLLVLGRGLVVISAAPIMGGMLLLSKLKNPTALPK